MIRAVAVSRRNLIRRFIPDCFAARKDFAAAAEPENEEEASGVCESRRSDPIPFDVARGRARSTAPRQKKERPSVAEKTRRD